MPAKASVKVAKARARAKQLQRYDEDERCAPATHFLFRSSHVTIVSKSAADLTLPLTPPFPPPPAHFQRHVHLGERA